MILFKAEASAWTPSAVQLQQVWVDPGARRRGHAQRALRDLCRLLLARTPLVCLFVRPRTRPRCASTSSIGMTRVDHVPLADLLAGYARSSHVLRPGREPWPLRAAPDAVASPHGTADPRPPRGVGIQRRRARERRPGRRRRADAAGRGAGARARPGARRRAARPLRRHGRSPHARDRGARARRSRRAGGGVGGARRSACGPLRGSSASTSTAPGRGRLAPREAAPGGGESRLADRRAATPRRGTRCSGGRSGRSSPSSTRSRSPICRRPGRRRRPRRAWT